MTAIYEAISWLLLNDAAVAAKVGAGVHNGWRRTTARETPCINHFEVLAGRPVDGVATCQIAVNCWTTEYAWSRHLAECVIDALNHYKGRVNDQFAIEGVEFFSKSELPEPEAGLFNVCVSFNVMYRM